jgi:hypothetical protein
MLRTSSLLTACVVIALSPLHMAAAQEAVNTPSATLPSPKAVVVRSLFRTTFYSDQQADRFGLDGRLYELDTRIAVGLATALSIEAQVTTALDDFDPSPGAPDGSDNLSMGDLTLSVKYRIWKKDPGPVDTMRLAVIAGAELPTGARRRSSRSVDPFAGLAFTGIFGRHGIGQSLSWLFTTGSDGPPRRPGETTADLLSFDTSYAYRLYPVEYTSQRVGAWYALLELNGALETNGDVEVMLGPGILYEAPRFAAEAAIQFPVARDVDRRPKRDAIVTAGIRLLF